MSIENNNFNQPPNPGPNPNNPGGQFNKDTGTFSQEYRHNPVSARVPERIARGVLSTGVLVLDSPFEFLIDFMQALTRPFQVASRVVLAPHVMEQFVAALRDNLRKYEERFGPPAPMPKPATDRRPTLQEIYDEFKLPDELLSGQYANAVIVGHSPAEFFFDFITNFYPTSAVSARVYMAAQQIPRTLDALTTALQRFHQRMATVQQQARLQQQPPPTPKPPEEPPANLQ